MRRKNGTSGDGREDGRGDGREEMCGKMEEKIEVEMKEELEVEKEVIDERYEVNQMSKPTHTPLKSSKQASTEMYKDRAELRYVPHQTKVE